MNTGNERAYGGDGDNSLFGGDGNDDFTEAKPMKTSCTAASAMTY